MKSEALRVLLLVLFVSSFSVSGCVAGSADDADDAADSGDDDDDANSGFSCDGITPEVTDVSPDELNEMLQDKDFLLVNVHVPHAGEIPGTDVHIRFDDTDALEEGLNHDLSTKAVFYCLTGPMSVVATDALVDLGYCRIYDLPAAMVGWEYSGYPLDP